MPLIWRASGRRAASVYQAELGVAREATASDAATLRAQLVVANARVKQFEAHACAARVEAARRGFTLSDSCAVS